MRTFADRARGGGEHGAGFTITPPTYTQHAHLPRGAYARSRRVARERSTLGIRRLHLPLEDLCTISRGRQGGTGAAPYRLRQPYARLVTARANAVS